MLKTVVVQQANPPVPPMINALALVNAARVACQAEAEAAAALAAQVGLTYAQLAPA